MKKFFLSSIFVSFLLMSSLVAYAIAWPLSSTPSLNIAMPSSYEPSGLAYNNVTNKLFTVSDGGQVTMMNLDGSSQVTTTTGGDNEAIAIKDPNSNKIYVGVEQPDSIVEYDLNTWGKRTWDLTSVMTGDANSGLEGLTFVPNGYHPFPNSSSGGIFYAGIQRGPVLTDTDPNNDYLIYAFDIDLSSTTGRVVQWWGIPVAAGTPTSDISDMYFSKETGVLYVLYDGSNTIAEMTTDGKLIKSYTGVPQSSDEQEGILVLPNSPYSSTKTADIYFAYDHLVASSGISKFLGYEVNFDVDGDGVMNNVDCAVNDKTLSTIKIYYQDLDGDGKGSDVSVSMCSLSVPSGYVTNSDDLNDTDFDNDGVSTGTDCNDHDATLSLIKTYYQDLDGDGLGSDVLTSVCSLNVPAGYVSNSDDLNDTDFDNDGVSTTSDCNDNDKNISALRIYYQDLDKDGLGSDVSISICSLTAPSGYVTNSDDLNDNSVGTDLDNDGVLAGVDCNDNDKTVSAIQTYYRDADGDGKGLATKTVKVCSSTAPSGYVADSSDKNDNDYDNDGVSKSWDCNDKNPLYFYKRYYYLDADGDGYGNKNKKIYICVPPTGYVTNSSDKNDSNPNVK